MKRLTLVALFALARGAVPAHAQSLSLAYHAGDTFKYSVIPGMTGPITTKGTGITDLTPA